MTKFQDKSISNIYKSHFHIYARDGVFSSFAIQRGKPSAKKYTQKKEKKGQVDCYIWIRNVHKKKSDETADEYDIQRLSRLYVVNAISMHLWINGVEKRKLWLDYGDSIETEPVCRNSGLLKPSGQLW